MNPMLSAGLHNIPNKNAIFEKNETNFAFFHKDERNEEASIHQPQFVKIPLIARELFFLWHRLYLTKNNLENLRLQWLIVVQILFDKNVLSPDHLLSPGVLFFSFF